MRKLATDLYVQFFIHCNLDILGRRYKNLSPSTAHLNKIAQAGDKDLCFQFFIYCNLAIPGRRYKILSPTAATLHTSTRLRKLATKIYTFSF
jgi:hypothetical protein